MNAETPYHELPSSTTQEIWELYKRIGPGAKLTISWWEKNLLFSGCRPNFEIRELTVIGRKTTEPFGLQFTELPDVLVLVDGVWHFRNVLPHRVELSY